MLLQYHSEVTLQDIDETNRYQTATKHNKARTVCMILGT